MSANSADSQPLGSQSNGSELLSSGRLAAGQLGASFRDPSGFLFERDGLLLRQINHSYAGHYDRLMESGLYASLVKAGLLVPHQEVSASPADPEQAYRVIQPERLPFISYPYEWSFSQLQDAALATLQIQKQALQFDQSLKDASAYNIQFYQGRPVLIDTLSFEPYPEGKPWVAYRQFCQHFLGPLALMANRDVRLGLMLRDHIDGLPLDLVSKLLPSRTRLSFPLLIHLHLHAASQKRYAAGPVTTGRQVSRTALLGLIDSLETGIRSLKWSPAQTEWAGYYDETNYSTTGLDRKGELVAEFIKKIGPATVWDLGANTGRFSRLASDQGIFTLAFDIDPGAVELNYRASKRQQETQILPLLLDLTNPSPDIGWQNQERMSLIARGPAGAVLALALVHHLAISNNTPLERLAAFFHGLSRWLMIEFVPKADSQVQRLLATRPDIFPNYTPEGFERAFSSWFHIRQVETLPDSQRRLYLMEGI